MLLLTTKCHTTAAIGGSPAVWLITVVVAVACTDVTTVLSNASDYETETTNVKTAIQDLYAAIKAFKDSSGARDSEKKVSLDDVVMTKAKYVVNCLAEMVTDREPLLPEVRSTAAATMSDDRRLTSLERKFTVASWLQRLDLRGANQMDGLVDRGMKTALASDTPLSVTDAGGTVATVNAHTQVQSRTGRTNMQGLETLLLNALKELEDMKRSTAGGRAVDDVSRRLPVIVTASKQSLNKQRLL